MYIIFKINGFVTRTYTHTLVQNGLKTQYFYNGNICILFAVVSAEDVSMGPVFVKEPPNRIDFSNGTGAVVECQARGNPQPDIIWVRSDGTAVGDVPGLRQVLLGQVLTHFLPVWKYTFV